MFHPKKLEGAELNATERNDEPEEHAELTFRSIVSGALSGDKSVKHAALEAVRSLYDRRQIDAGSYDAALETVGASTPDESVQRSAIQRLGERCQEVFGRVTAGPNPAARLFALASCSALTPDAKRYASRILGMYGHRDFARRVLKQSCAETKPAPDLG